MKKEEEEEERRRKDKENGKMHSVDAERYKLHEHCDCIRKTCSFSLIHFNQSHS